jgi:hypothetical protein
MPRLARRLATVAGAGLIAMSIAAPMTANAAECGFTFTDQTWTNCAPEPRRVVLAFYDGTFQKAGEMMACIPPGTHGLTRWNADRLTTAARELGPEPCTP